MKEKAFVMIPQFIDTQPELLEIIQKLDNSPVLFLDTEFIREQTYFPIACLLQIYNEGETAYLIDLKSETLDLAPLLELLKNPDIIKVLHSGRQDLEIFYYDFGFLPDPLFDTQIASSFLGYGDQISFEAIVKEKLNIQIDKSQQRTDWRKRPLNEKQMIYAASDVYYLAPIYYALIEELKTQNRTKWAQSEIDKLLVNDVYKINEKNILKKVKHRITDNTSLAILSGLALWREHQAVQRNRVRSRIISDEILVAVAEAKPRTLEAFARIRKISEKHREHYGKEWFEIVTKAREACDDFHIEKTERLEPHLEKLHNLLNLYTKQAADDLKISPKLLASSAELTAFLQDKYNDFMHDWRFDIYGQYIKKIIDGEVSIKYKKEELRIYIE